jgi:predicted acyl esterase
MFIRLVFGVLAVLLLARVGAEEKTLDVMVEARDMAELATTVYLPGGDGPWPCILSRTPYNKDGLRGFAKQFVEHGYAFVAQDCRGKHKSPGKWLPFRTDPEDGYDTVEWIARQPWSNGKVGMWGGSALGITTHLAATQAPPHLKCAYVVVAPASARRQTVYMGGVYRKEMNDGWLLGQSAGYAIADNISNPPGSAYWNWREIADFHHRMTIPIYELGGWFDIFSQGAIDNFTGLQANGAGLAAGNQKLVLGPYAHGSLGGRLSFPFPMTPRRCRATRRGAGSTAG